MSTQLHAQLKQILGHITEQLTLLEDESKHRFAGGASKNLLCDEIREINQLTRELANRAHKVQFQIEWGLPAQPEWFDHYIDQYSFWRERQNPLWVERGTFGLLAIAQGSRALELCCGDGFNTYHFYSNRCSSIIAVDFDQAAIKHAKKYNSCSNITFQECDVRTQFPVGVYDNIIWDAAIEHFSPTEIDRLLTNIKQCLTPAGIVSGYTIIEKQDGTKSLDHHEYEFKSKEDLRRFFEPHFMNVKVFETIYPSRSNLYFWASNSKLPFDTDWHHLTTFRR